MDQSKFESYLFNSNHPANRGKARLWRSIFGLREGDGLLLESLIREQLDRAVMVEKTPVQFGKGLERSARRWELTIPRFAGPNDNVAPLLTAWALNPGHDFPHLTTAYPITG